MVNLFLTCFPVSIPIKQQKPFSMFWKSQLFLFSPLFFLPLITAQSPTGCQTSCGSGHFPYPFGFSAACGIPLNCSQNGTAFIGEFPILSLSSDTVKVSVPAKCYRPLTSIGMLFGSRYAPKARNAFLLQNCSSPASSCMLPPTMVQTNFETLNCSMINNSLISCLSQNQLSGFYDKENVTKSPCDYFVSSISAEILNSEATGVSLEVQTAELGWWLEGDQCLCDAVANCTTFVSPVTRAPAYRCSCPEGFVGDGFLAGGGCRKASTRCNPVKYIFGECGGTKRFLVLIFGVVGGASVVASLGLICCLLKRRSENKARNITKRRLTEVTGACSIPVYAYRDIERATNNFSEKQRLGTGAYGTVYAGKLHGDEWVAIKRVKSRDNDSVEEVMNEIKLISSVSHPHLVRLLGCSMENGVQVLVYEFMANGTLCQQLQRERGDGLDWPIRLTIATEVAQAIAHLHSAVNPPIFHRDIKSSNILLDYEFKSKVADFGLSKLGMTEISHISTAPRGTPGYLDPQYHQDFQLSDKSDVYSFGVVLVEIITAMKVVDFSRPKNEVNLASLATSRIANGRLAEIIDPCLDLHKDPWTFLSLHKVAELAFRCLASHRDMRPSMMEVAAELEQISLMRTEASEEKYFTPANGLSSCSSSTNSSEMLPRGLADSGLDSGNLSLVKTEDDSLSAAGRVRKDSKVSLQDLSFGEEGSSSSTTLVDDAVQ